MFKRLIAVLRGAKNSPNRSSILFLMFLLKIYEPPLPFIRLVPMHGRPSSGSSYISSRPKHSKRLKPKPIKKPYSWILDPYLRHLRSECELSEVTIQRACVQVGSHYDPSTLSVARALTHAVTPKDKWLSERGADVEWPVAGIPKALHLDKCKGIRICGLGARLSGIWDRTQVPSARQAALRANRSDQLRTHHLKAGLEDPLAQGFLRGNIKQGDTLEVHAAGEQLALKVTQPEQREPADESPLRSRG